ncbi:MAG: hypothetical protein ABI839_07900 [Verrucomicrobiota bacterium]
MSWKMLGGLLVVSILSTACALGDNPAPDPAQCGPFPKLYKELVWNWLEKSLVDANSAKIEWEGDPIPADLGEKEAHLNGWLVRFKINSRNRFGAFTGKQSHAALIRDNAVIKGVGFGY